MRVLIFSTSGNSARLAAACRTIQNFNLLATPRQEQIVPDRTIALLTSAEGARVVFGRYPDGFRAEVVSVSGPRRSDLFSLVENDASSWRRFWMAIGARGDYLSAWKHWTDSTKYPQIEPLPRLSILIPTLRARRALRQALVEDLQRQVAAYPDVELLLEEDDGTLPNGTKRNRLLQAARGEYVAFVDDDDWVPGHYVSRLRAGTAAKPDVVTFHQLRLACHPGGLPQLALWDFSLTAPACAGLAAAAANHLCAWRRDLARRIAFVPHLTFDDDYFWSMPLLASRLASHEEHLPEVLYVYRQDLRRSACQYQESVAATRSWAGRGVECFLRGQEILIACQNIDRVAGSSEVAVFNAAGQHESLDRRQFDPFFLCQTH